MKFWVSTMEESVEAAEEEVEEEFL